MRALLASIAGLLSLATPAHAADPVAPEPVAPTTALVRAELFVELVINGQAIGSLVSLAQENGRLWIDANALREAGITTSATGRVDLSAPPGFTATYDAPAQRLLLDVPPTLLPTRRIAGAPLQRMTTSVDTGALLNWDLFVQHGSRHTTAALLSEQRVFGAFGTLSNTGVIRSGFDGRNGYLRYDTRYHRVFENNAIELTAGDLITRALPWTTSVRMGGVQIARNFAVRPDLVTVPLPRFAGEARVPSGVDLFINGYRQSTTQVEPGRFVLENVPVVNGAGEARVVTTDAVGRQIATVIPFYVAPALLRRGLTDFAVEAGALRRGFGQSSFGYRQAAASASLRHGLTNTVTVSAHAETAPGLTGGGGAVAWRAGLLGAVNASFAASDHSGRRGTQVTAGYSYEGHGFSVGAEHIARSSGYSDLGSFDLKRLPGSTRSDRVSGSAVLPGIGSVGLGFVSARSGDGFRARVISASASLPIGRQVSAFAAVDYDIIRRRASAQLRVIVPLGGGRTVASTGVSQDPRGTTRVSGSIGHAVPSEGGFGYNADGAYDSNGRTIGQASGQWRGQHIALEAGAATTGTSSNMWAGASGSVVLLGGRVFTARALPDAFALVSTGVPGVPVSFENQSVGTTDRRGHLFVPSVTAYHANRFAIDPTVLPIGAVATAVDVRAAVRPASGAIIALPVRLVRSVTIALVDALGAPLAPGTTVAISNGETAVVGWDGVVLIEDARGSLTLTARGRTAGCTARFDVPGTAQALSNLGNVRCE